MIAADVVRGAALVPVAVAGLTGRLTLWGVIVTGLVVTTASAYFTPALGALLPAVVGRRNLQPANGLVTATNNVALLGGWAVAAGLLAIVSVGAFFAVNAISFFVSAALIARTRTRSSAMAGSGDDLAVLAGLDAMRVRPGLRSAVGMHALGVAVNTGVWTVGIAVLARSQLGSASGLSLLLVATAGGAITATAALTRFRVRRQGPSELPGVVHVAAGVRADCAGRRPGRRARRDVPRLRRLGGRGGARSRHLGDAAVDRRECPRTRNGNRLPGQPRGEADRPASDRPALRLPRPERHVPRRRGCAPDLRVGRRGRRRGRDQEVAGCSPPPRQSPDPTRARASRGRRPRRSAGR